MDNIEKNIHRNGLDGGRVIAVPYIWGEDAAGVLAVNGGRQYDVLLASECLWRHEQVSTKHLAICTQVYINNICFYVIFLI